MANRGKDYVGEGFELSMRRVFVTGGTGFIGSHIVERLRQCYDIDLYLLTRQKLVGRDNVHYVQGSILDEVMLSSAMAEIKPDILLHLAWDVKSEGYASSAQNDAWTVWSKRLLEIFLAHGGKNVVASGTCFEYDFSNRLPLREDMLGTPSTSYGKAKLATQRIYENLCRQYGARMVWGRIFYPYGKGEEKRKLLSAFADSLRRNQPFICKMPENRIDYIHISDIAKIFEIFLLNKDVEGIVNVGTGEVCKLKEILAKIASMMGKESLLGFSSGSDISVIADTRKLSSLYDCSKFIRLDEGLKYLLEVNDG